MELTCSTAWALVRNEAVALLRWIQMAILTVLPSLLRTLVKCLSYIAASAFGSSTVPRQQINSVYVSLPTA